MSSQPKDSTEFTVRFTKAAYLVLDPAGIEVERYPFDLADFPARRAAYREAMADAEVRTTVAARAVNWGSRPALSLEDGREAPPARRPRRADRGPAAPRLHGGGAVSNRYCPTYPEQLARALTDPMLSLWVDPDALAAFVERELRDLDPEAQRQAERAADWLDRVYAQTAQDEGWLEMADSGAEALQKAGLL
jgi:hypothetical protein